jgi:N-acyl-D-amino-acid deacylase
MLVVLRNQPAHQIVAALVSQSTTTRRLAEADLAIARQNNGSAQSALNAGQALLSALAAQTKEASANIQAAISPEQDFVASQLAGLGATGIQRYSAINMLRAEIPTSAMDAARQISGVAELIAVGSHQTLLDLIEDRLTNPNGLAVLTFDDNDEAFLRLLDRVIDDRGLLVAAGGGAPGFNTIPAADYSIESLSKLGSFAHLAVKTVELNGAGSVHLSSSVSTDRPFRLYIGSAPGPFNTTLAWDRHFTDGLQPTLQILNLVLYNQSDGTGLAETAAPSQNTQQATPRNGGDAVIKVRMQSPPDGASAEEPFAVAISTPGFRLAQGPKLSMKCGSDCIVRNDGDLPAFDVTAQAQGTEYKLGALGPSASAKFTPAGKVTNATVTSQSFGEVFTAAAGDPCTTPWTISPQPLILTPDVLPAGIVGMSGQLSVTPPTGCATPWLIDADPSNPVWPPLIINTSGPVSPTGTWSFTVTDRYGWTAGGNFKWMMDIHPQSATVIAPTFGSIIVQETSAVPTVKLVSPTGGQYTIGKDSITISWTWNPGVPPRNSTGIIELMNGTVSAGVIANGVTLAPSGGTLNWLVPVGLAPGTYTVRIRSTDPTITAQDQSPPVTVRATDPPRVVITSVTATDGVAGFDNMQMQIGWQMSGAPPANTTCTIDVLHGSAVVFTKAGVPLNSGGYSWYIPLNTPADTNYQVRITPASASIAANQSRNNVVVRVWHDPFDQAISAFIANPTGAIAPQPPQPIPGAEFGIMHSGKLAYTQGYGGSKPNELFRVASLTKPATAAAIYALIEQGKLSLSDSVFSNGHNKGILPGYSARDPQVYAITVGALLSHVGGFNLTTFATQYRNAHPHTTFNDTEFDPMFQSIRIEKDLNINYAPHAADVVKYVLANFTIGTPGQAYHYSNVGYAALGLVIEKVSGKSYQDYVTGMFGKIGANNTFFGASVHRRTNEVEYFDFPGAPLGCSVFPRYPASGATCPDADLAPHRSVPTPDGGFYLEAMEAHGGLLTNVADLLRFEASLTGQSQVPLLREHLTSITDFQYWALLSVPLFPLYSTDTLQNSPFWLGDFPGTMAIMAQVDVPSQTPPAPAPAVAAKHIGFALFFNSRPNQTAAARGTTIQNLVVQLNRLAIHLQEWPSTDLFR